MRNEVSLRVIAGTGLAAAILFSAHAAQAGGFAVREQSAEFQGLSFAGSGAGGGGLSSMFWNSAAAGTIGSGVTLESHYSFIIPDADVTVLPGTTGPGAVSGARSTDIGRLGIVPASYMGWRYSDDLVFALGINSPFGLTTKPDDPNWGGSYHARTAKLVTFNFNPVASYQVANGFWIGAGAQVEHLDLKGFKTNSGLANAPGFPGIGFTGDSTGLTSAINGTSVGIGFTAGLMFQPSKATSIGVGFRSSVRHDIKGSAQIVGLNSPVVGTAAVEAELETPETVNISIRQALTPTMRVLGTAEWTNWSRLEVIPINTRNNALLALGAGNGATIANLDFQWDDGWHFALGGEIDVMPNLTLRAGGAYEISPIQNATQRLPQLPDSDRWWASIGATYHWSKSTKLDFAYSHVFFDDAPIDRETASTANAFRLIGEADQSADILSVSLKTKLGGHEEALK